jgi:hypothetical protein
MARILDIRGTILVLFLPSVLQHPLSRAFKEGWLRHEEKDPVP